MKEVVRPTDQALKSLSLSDEFQLRMVIKEGDIDAAHRLLKEGTPVNKIAQMNPKEKETLLRAAVGLSFTTFSFCEFQDVLTNELFLSLIQCNPLRVKKIDISGCVLLRGNILDDIAEEKKAELETLNISDTHIDKISGFFPKLRTLVADNCDRLYMLNIDAQRLEYLSMKYCCRWIMPKVRSLALRQVDFTGSSSTDGHLSNLVVDMLSRDDGIKKLIYAPSLVTNSKGETKSFLRWLIQERFWSKEILQEIMPVLVKKETVEGVERLNVGEKEKWLSAMRGLRLTDISFVYFKEALTNTSFQLIIDLNPVDVRKLDISGCYCLTESVLVGLFFSKLTALEELNVSGTLVGEIRRDQKFPKLQKLVAHDCPQMKSVQIDSSELRFVEIRDCTQLGELSLTSSVLERVDVSGCTALQNWDPFQLVRERGRSVSEVEALISGGYFVINPEGKKTKFLKVLLDGLYQLGRQAEEEGNLTEALMHYNEIANLRSISHKLYEKRNEEREVLRRVAIICAEGCCSIDIYEDKAIQKIVKEIEGRVVKAAEEGNVREILNVLNPATLVELQRAKSADGLFLMLAAQQDYVGVVKRIVDCRKNQMDQLVKEENSFLQDYSTALRLGAMNGCVRTVGYLLGQKAFLLAINDNYKDALIVAAERKDEKMVNVFINHIMQMPMTKEQRFIALVSLIRSEKTTRTSEKFILRQVVNQFLDYFIDWEASRLDLSLFGLVLTDEILEGILKRCRKDITELNLSSCARLSGRVVSIIGERCPKIERLDLSFARIHELRGEKGWFKELKWLNVKGSEVLQVIDIDVPALEELNASYCEDLSAESLSGLLQRKRENKIQKLYVEGCTQIEAFWHALEEGDLIKLEKLVEDLGIDLNMQREKTGETAVHVVVCQLAQTPEAERDRHMQMLSWLLLKQRIDLTKEDRQGRNAIDLARELDLVNLAKVEKLLRAQSLRITEKRPIFGMEEINGKKRKVKIGDKEIVILEGYSIYDLDLAHIHLVTESQDKLQLDLRGNEKALGPLVSHIRLKKMECLGQVLCFSYLQELNLSGNRLIYNEALNLIEALQGHQHLTKIDLSHNRICFDEARYSLFSEKFKGFRQLQEVDLSQNFLHPNCDEHFERQDEQSNAFLGKNPLAFFKTCYRPFPSMLNPERMITKDKWVVALVCEKEHAMIFLEGMRENGQLFFDVYHITLPKENCGKEKEDQEKKNKQEQQGNHGCRCPKKGGVVSIEGTRVTQECNAGKNITGKMERFLKEKYLVVDWEIDKGWGERLKSNVERRVGKRERFNYVLKNCADFAADRLKEVYIPVERMRSDTPSQMVKRNIRRQLEIEAEEERRWQEREREWQERQRQRHALHIRMT